MNEKGRITLRVMAGGYLAYLGVDLLKNTIMKQTDNPVMYGGFGAAFLIIGAGYIIYSWKRYKDVQKREQQEDKEILDEKHDGEE